MSATLDSLPATDSHRARCPDCNFTGRWTSLTSATAMLYAHNRTEHPSIQAVLVAASEKLQHAERMAIDAGRADVAADIRRAGHMVMRVIWSALKQGVEEATS